MLFHELENLNSLAASIFAVGLFPQPIKIPGIGKIFSPMST